MDEPLIEIKNLGKTYCRDYKRSLFYGVLDSMKEISGIISPNLFFRAPVEKLRKGEFWSNRDLTFDVFRGESVGLIGHNGAGKTTLLKMLSGLIKPDCGSITINGSVGSLIALGAGFSPVLTGRENIYINGSILGMHRSEIDARMNDILEFSEIGEFIDSPVQNYSSGMQVRLGFAVASALDPDIMLLDEVLAVGDISFQSKCLNRLAHLKSKGTAFILVSHNMQQISRHTEKVVYLKNGKIHFIGPTSEGIKRFKQDMSASRNPKVQHSKNPNGSGKIVFEKIELLDGKGKSLTASRPGEPLKINIYFTLSSEKLKNLIVDLKILSDEQIVFHEESPRDNGGFRVDSSGYISVIFENFPYNSDNITINLMAFDGKTKETFDWRQGIEIPSEKHKSNDAICIINPTWEIVENSNG